MAENGNSDKSIGDLLTPKQHRAIAALLSESDVKSAANAAKVGERTLHRWLKTDPNFVLMLRDAEAEFLDRLTRQLVRLSTKATGAIETVLDDPEASNSVKLRAADIVLSRLLQLRELANLEMRITALEAAEHYRKDEH